MIVWGTKPVTRTVDSGSFFCPNCGSSQHYELKSLRKHGHVYWIPLMPMGDSHEYVECQGCQETFRPEVLTYDPAESQKDFKSEFEYALRRLMTLMMMADGSVADEEVATIMGIYEAVSGHSLTRPEVLQEVVAAREAGLEAVEYAQYIEPYLNDHGKELVVKALLSTAAADGKFEQSEWESLINVAMALGMTSSHVKGIVAEFSEPGDHPALKN